MFERLPERLMELRREQKETQQQVAKALEIRPATLSAYERGVSLPSLEVAAKLAAHFSVPLGYLVGLEEKQEEEFAIRTRADFLRHVAVLAEVCQKSRICVNRDGDHRVNTMEFVLETYSPWLVDGYSAISKLSSLYQKDELITRNQYLLLKNDVLRRYERVFCEDSMNGYDIDPDDPF